MVAYSDMAQTAEVRQAAVEVDDELPPKPSASLVEISSSSEDEVLCIAKPKAKPHQRRADPCRYDARGDDPYTVEEEEEAVNRYLPPDSEGDEL